MQQQDEIKIPAMVACRSRSLAGGQTKTPKYKNRTITYSHLISSVIARAASRILGFSSAGLESTTKIWCALVERHDYEIPEVPSNVKCHLLAAEVKELFQRDERKESDLRSIVR